MTSLPGDYDAWRLSGPEEALHAVGTDAGDECLRYTEGDEDWPRARLLPCTGTMVEQDGEIACDTCGELA